MEKIELRGMSNQLCAPSFTPLCMCLFGEKSSSKARSSRSNGSFNNYVDKIGGGHKMSVFVHAQGIKTVQAGGGGQKKGQNSVPVVVE